jgi:penicillin-binding protein 2
MFEPSTSGPTRELSPLLLRRVPVTIGVVVASLLLVIARLWYLQVVHGEELRSLSEHNRIRLRRVPAERGLILDRHGTILADNRPSFDVKLVPEDAGDVPAVVARLGQYLGDGPVLEGLAQVHRKAPYQPVVLRRDISWPDVAAIETHRLDLPGVTLDVEPRRIYPYGSLAAHLLGYVGEATPGDLESRDDLGMGDVLGKAGVERPFDRELRGIRGRQEIEVDALGRRIGVLAEEPETPGRDIVLTIDRATQAAAEAALEGHRGAIVALDPNSGEVLAMASRPTFDPNDFASGVTTEAWRALVADRHKPLTNRALQGQYPPASTFKIVVGVAALEKKKISPSGDVCCWGGMPFGGRVFNCWRKHGHGCLGFHDAMLQSCDVYFYEAGHRVGVDAIAEYSRKFGLGARTGIGIGYEEPGLIPDSAWKKRRFGEPWYPGETLSVAIGQGFVLATPLQMATMIATVANGGTRYKPHVVKRIEGGEGDAAVEFGPEVVEKVELRPATLSLLHRSLEDVVAADRGTGRRAAVDGIKVAGKTGTAQVAGLAKAQGGGEDVPEQFRDHAWFVGYAPAGAPTIAVAVLVEHTGHHGGTVAAPMAKAVFEAHFGLAPPSDGSETHEVRQAAHRPL